MLPRRWGVSSIICAPDDAFAGAGRPHLRSADIWKSLRERFADFEAYRSDVIILCATHVLAGVVLARIAFGSDLLPLLFSIASGFAIIGPLAAVGLYEMSRLRAWKLAGPMPLMC